jgi:hypothetical protein
MGFQNVGALVQSMTDSGKYIQSTFRKSLVGASSVGTWFDSSYFSGNPPVNFYASEPLLAATLNGNKGIYHGQNVAPDTKYLTKMGLYISGGTPLPMTNILCDYVLYYPFIDTSETSEQFLDNTVTLPRYSNGQGVRAFLVTQGTSTGSGVFTLKYTNQIGVSDRVSPATTCNSSGTAGFLTNNVVSRNTPFIPLQSEDTGIRSVESITFSVSNGGISSLVLVYPLAHMNLIDALTTSEKDFFKDAASMPRIQDGAYLNLISCSNGSINSVVRSGYLEFAWG